MKGVKVIWLLALLMMVGCKKSKAPEPEGPSVVNPPVINTVSYTNENAFAQFFAGNGFKNPTQLVLKKVALSAGYTTVYGFAVPPANQVKGFKWDVEDEQTEEWRPQGITGFKWAGKTYLAITWYAISPTEIPGIRNEHKGVRLAIVDISDMNNITYNYILLVQNISNSNTSLLYDKPKNAFI